MPWRPPGSTCRRLCNGTMRVPPSGTAAKKGANPVTRPDRGVVDSRDEQHEEREGGHDDGRDHGGIAEQVFRAVPVRPVTDEYLIKQGTWQYTHYYD